MRCRYTHALKDLDAGNLPEWEKLPCPELAKKYWRLKAGCSPPHVHLALSIPASLPPTGLTCTVRVLLNCCHDRNIHCYHAHAP